MRRINTAIIHVRHCDRPPIRDMIERVLRPLRGVRRVYVEPVDQFLTVRFDQDLTGLAEIVRTIEDGGAAVSSVAQRSEASRGAAGVLYDVP